MVEEAVEDKTVCNNNFSSPLILLEHKLLVFWFHVPSLPHTRLLEVKGMYPSAQENEQVFPGLREQLGDNTAFSSDREHNITKKKIIISYKLLFISVVIQNL